MSARDRVRAALFRTRVMVILDAGVDGPAGLVRMGRALSRAGLAVFQLRAKRLADSAHLALARRVREAVAPGWLVLNDRCDLALAAGAAGVHLGAGDLPLRAARRLLGPGRALGASAGNPRELRAAVAGRPDWVSVGPFARTATKVDAGRALGVRRTQALLGRVPRGSVRLAVGGITPDNVGGAFAGGAEAVAVAGWWWRGGGPEAAARRMCAAIRQATT